MFHTATRRCSTDEEATTEESHIRCVYHVQERYLIWDPWRCRGYSEGASLLTAVRSPVVGEVGRGWRGRQDRGVGKKKLVIFHLMMTKSSITDKHTV